MNYHSGRGFPSEIISDLSRMQALFANKWFFVGTRADVSKPRDYFKFNLFDEQYFLVHGSDGEIRCLVNRCAHQSARLVNDDTGKCAASIICPNHQWAYKLNGGALHTAAGMSAEFHESEGKDFALDQIPLREIDGMLFACLDSEANDHNMSEVEAVLAPYTNPFGLGESSSGESSYKAAYHHRESIDANWLVVMINNRECCHCAANHKRLLNLFDPASFNGASSPAYDALFKNAVDRWEKSGLAWQEDAFETSPEVRVARYPMAKGFKSISFDGKPVSKKTIGPFVGQDYDEGTLSFWFNPNAWIHFVSDHIAVNWVLPINADRCELYTSWIVASDAVEGEDYTEDHLTEVWKLTNQEDVGLCMSMNAGVKSKHYHPGPFSENEKFCTQFCDWYMANSGKPEGESLKGKA